MYESIKNQVKYERCEGIRSEMALHFEDYKPDEHNDNGFIPVSWSVAAGADIWVLHSGFPESMKEVAKKKIRVAVLHGPTEHMFFKEWNNTSQSFNLHVNLLWDMDATICINKHEYDIMKLYDEKKGRCRYIPNSIDLEELEDVTPWQYESHPAIISCDTPRVEKLPMHIIWAMPKIVERIPTARLNLFSLLLEPIAIYRNVFCRSHERKLEKFCENIQLSNRNLKPFQAGADIGFNNNYSGIASRVTMEMMALGTPVISYSGDYTPYHARAFDLDSIAEQVERCWKDLSAPGSTLREDTKKYAKENFDRGKYVKQYIELYNELLSKRQG
jgi:glycosyltransferase involved in cell wall biosynthesis